ncbi:MAG: hypothetical protein HYX97_06185, partial [Chloroflexi bacterium]|nr:hypothetical protein [Chloroflexota bacterium]
QGVPREKAQGKLGELYEELAKTGASRFSDILMPMTHHPNILQTLRLGGPDGLAPEFDRELAESLAVVVSSTNGCAW